MREGGRGRLGAKQEQLMNMSRRQGSNPDFMKKCLFCRSWHKFQVELQHKILARMRALGMMPVRKTTSGKCRKTSLFKCRKLTVLKYRYFQHLTELAPSAIWFVLVQEGRIVKVQEYICVEVKENNCVEVHEHSFVHNKMDWMCKHMHV